MDYRDYAAEDFVLDTSFRNWVFGNDPAAITFWENWLLENPDKAGTIRKARQLALALRVREPHLSEGEILAARTAIRTAAEASREPASIAAGPIPLYRQSWFRAAAVWLAVVSALVLSLYVYHQTGRQTYATGYGETRRISLPDGSTVMLNANSTLQTPRRWDPAVRREVWLSGEAFFTVTEKPGAGNARFVVHTRDLAVEVLGTRFNVNSRPARTQVVLSTGKVQIHLNGATDRPAIPMQPGDLVEVSGKASRLVRRTVQPQVYSAWQTHKLVFDKTPVAEIARLLKDNYGLKVTFENPASARRRVSGTIPSNNQAVLLEALSALLDMEIVRQEEELIFRNRPEMEE